jgi:Zn-finger nucleic acid-binding protein
MLCPACRSELVVVEYGGVDLDGCPRCRGLWFDADELEILFSQRGAEEPSDLERTLASLEHGPHRGRRCPRCRGRLMEIEVPTAASEQPRVPLHLDRCHRGDGLWFDRDELGRLVAGFPSEKSAALAAVTDFLGRFAAPGRA